MLVPEHQSKLRKVRRVVNNTNWSYYDNTLFQGCRLWGAGLIIPLPPILAEIEVKCS